MIRKYIYGVSSAFIKEYDLATYDILDQKGCNYFLLNLPEKDVKNFIHSMGDISRYLFYHNMATEAIKTMTRKELKRIVKYFPEDDKEATTSRKAILDMLEKMKNEKHSCLLC